MIDSKWHIYINHVPQDTKHVPQTGVAPKIAQQKHNPSLCFYVWQEVKQHKPQ